MKISLLANTGAFTEMLINVHCPLKKRKRKKREKRFSFKQVDVSYTLELIDKIGLSPSLTCSPEQQQRTDSPGPSCVSMKSNRSMDAPLVFKDGRPSSEER